MVGPADCFTCFYYFNNGIENISIDVKKTEKQLVIHIMNNMCKLYKDLKLVIKNKVSFIYELEKLQTTIRDNWETYYCDKETSDDSGDE